MDNNKFIESTAMDYGLDVSIVRDIYTRNYDLFYERLEEELKKGANK